MGFQLPLLDRAARLQRLEVLLDPPAAAVPVDDGKHFVRRVDGLKGPQTPFDGLLALRRIGLDHAHDVEAERLCGALVRRCGAQERDSRGGYLEERSTCMPWREMLPVRRH